jgi:hypothetical protein
VTHADLKDRGTDALDAIDRHVALTDGLYAARPNDSPAPHGKPRPYASIWEAGIELSALNAAAGLDPTRLPRATRFADALAAYRVTTTNGLRAYQPYPSSAHGDIYYDDNEWLVLAFLETYDLTHNDHYLLLAKETFAFVASGESPDLGGGIWWRTRRDSKNTCSNAPAICAAARLYQTTSDPAYLHIALRLYRWVNAHVQDTDGLYWDTLRLDNSLEKTKWSYNTAIMIRANVLLHAATHDPNYLAEAQRLARAAEAKWFRPTDGACTDPAQFAHLLCEALLYLGDADGDPAHLATVRRTLDALAATKRHDTYPRRWDGWTTKEIAGTQPPSLISQASAARAFLVAAPYDSTRPAP